MNCDFQSVSIRCEINLKRSNKNKIRPILQSEIAECGLACAAMVSSFYGKQINLAAMREKFNISSRGMNLKDLVHVLDLLEMTSIAFRISLEEVGKIETPAILHWNLDHFVVLSKIVFDTSGRVQSLVIVDPGYGEREIYVDELSEYFQGVVLEVTPSQSFQRGNFEKKETLGLVIESIKSRKKLLLVSLGLSCLVEIIGVAPPFFMQLLIDKVIPSHSVTNVPVILFLFVLVLFIQKTVLLIRNRLVNRIRHSLSLELFSKITFHLIRLPLLFFEKRSLGEINSKILSLDSIESSVSIKLALAVVDLIFSIIMLGIIFSYNALMSSVVVFFVLLFLLLKYKYTPRFISLSEKKIKSHQKEIDHFTESVFCIQTIKLFNKQFSRYQEYLNLLNKRKRDELNIDDFKSNFSILEDVWKNIENLTVSALGCIFVIKGDLTLGAFLSFLAFKLNFTSRIYTVGEVLYESRTFLAHLFRLSDLTSQPIENLDDVENITLSDRINKLKDGDPFLELKDVSYRYADNDEYVIKHVNLIFYYREGVVITGESGSGKTTLLKLLLGILTPTSGEIKVCGLTLNEETLFEFRKNTSSVMQNDMLLSGSLLDNISFFDSAADIHNVKAAAEKAAINLEINKMPMGYKTYIKAFNPSISGGQVQRILLARALYKNPSFLFLDEASSHLDIENEQKINQVMNEIRITRIAVAHRLETIKNADRQIILQNGSVKDDRITSQRDCINTPFKYA